MLSVTEINSRIFKLIQGQRLNQRSKDPEPSGASQVLRPCQHRRGLLPLSTALHPFRLSTTLCIFCVKPPNEAIKETSPKVSAPVEEVTEEGAA